MRAFRRHLRACTWLAVLAMFALAFGPTISRLALPEAPPTDAAMSRLATSADHAAMHHGEMHHAVMDGAAMHAHHHHAASTTSSDAGVLPPPAEPVHRHTHTLEHCALCAVAASAFAVAPVAPALITVARPPSIVVAAADPCIAPGRTPWSPASPRGPPARA